MAIYGYEVPGGALSSKKNYPDNGYQGNLPLQGDIPMVELGFEPRTS
jgi:hypothetical protein